MPKLSIGFPSGKKKMNQPYETSFRCDENTVRQLEVVKEYLEDLEQPAENTSETIRIAIKFGSIWCRESKIGDEIPPIKKLHQDLADDRMKELAEAEKREAEARK